jgi:hypothetical protein
VVDVEVEIEVVLVLLEVVTFVVIGLPNKACKLPLTNAPDTHVWLMYPVPDRKTHATDAVEQANDELDAEDAINMLQDESAYILVSVVN